MTIRELKDKIENLPDDLTVLVPVTTEFDGKFYSPCVDESGMSEVGIDEHDEETENVFLLLPHGFGEEDEDDSYLLN